MNSILQTFEQRLKDNQKLTPKMQAILTESLTLFSEKGYSNTSTKDIATAANVAEGTIFKHFGSKENLLYATLIPMVKLTLAQEWAIQLNQAKKEIENQNLRQFLETLLAPLLEKADENIKVIKVISMEFVYQEALRQKLFKLIPPKIIREMNDIFDDLKQRNEMVDYPNDIIFRLLIGPLVTFILSQDMQPTTLEQRKVEIHQLLDFLAKGLEK